MTSRDTHRWVVPKGWPLPKHPDHEAAAREAWEEAGVRGEIHRRPLGTYDYDKRQKTGAIGVRVSAFLLDVHEEASSWPEARERERSWFSLKDAVKAVDEDGLKRILRALAKEPPHMKKRAV